MSRVSMSAVSGNVLVVVAASLWGTTGTAQALAPASASSWSIGSVRLLIGGAVLLGVSRWRGSGQIGPLLRRQPTYLAAAAMAAYQPLFFTGLTKTGVAVGTAIAIGSAPILTGTLSAIVDKVRPSSGWFRSTAVAISGVVLLMVSTAGDPSLDPLGALLTLGAGGCYAVYVVATRRLAPTATPEHIAGAVFGLAALAMVPAFFSTDSAWITEASGLLAALWLGLGATALAYLLFTSGLRTVAAPTAATLSLAEPVTATLLALLLLREPPTALGLGGGLLVLAGLLMIARNGGNQASSYGGGT